VPYYKVVPWTIRKHPPFSAEHKNPKQKRKKGKGNKTKYYLLD
jgi:hypothetical protein